MSCECSYFTKRKPSKEILDEFYNYANLKSKKAKQECPTYERIAYGEDKKQFVDVFFPKVYNKSRLLDSHLCAVNKKRKWKNIFNCKALLKKRGFQIFVKNLNGSFSNHMSGCT